MLQMRKLRLRHDNNGPRPHDYHTEELEIKLGSPGCRASLHWGPRSCNAFSSRWMRLALIMVNNWLYRFQGEARVKGTFTATSRLMFARASGLHSLARLVNEVTRHARQG